MGDTRSIAADTAAACARPLVMRCGAFGDMVLLTTLLRQLHARFGQPVDVISSGPWTEPLLAGQPEVGELFILKSRKTPYWLSLRQQQLVRWLRRRGAGPTWFCDPGVGRELLARGGIADSWLCDAREFPIGPQEHFTEYWIRFAQLDPPAFKNRLPQAAALVPAVASIEIDAAARAGLEDWLRRRGIAQRPLVLIQAGNKRSLRRGSRRRATNTKYWPEERWAAVIQQVRAQRPEHAILLLGAPPEYALNEDIARLAGVPQLYNVADDLPIRVLLPLFERADSLISVDTGPAHAAAALACPTVTLFGVANPVLYRPGGVATPVVTLTGIVDGKPDILGIEPDAVVNAWRTLTASASRSR